MRERVGVEPLARCYWCDAVTGFRLVVDHVVPRSKGGPDESWNGVPCCPACNTAKSNMWPTDFAEHRLYDRISASWGIPIDWARASEWLITRKARAMQVEAEFQRWAVETGDGRALRHLSRRNDQAA